MQGIGLAATALLVGSVARPTIGMLMVPLAVFGYGQGMVLAPLFSAVLTQVRHAHAGSGAGILTTTQQVANGTGVVLVGGVYFAVQGLDGDRWALLAAMIALGCTIVATIAFLAAHAGHYMWLGKYSASTGNAIRIASRMMSVMTNGMTP